MKFKLVLKFAPMQEGEPSDVTKDTEEVIEIMEVRKSLPPHATKLVSALQFQGVQFLNSGDTVQIWHNFLDQPRSDYVHILVKKVPPNHHMRYAASMIVI